jgi:hypothetical protein
MTWNKRELVEDAAPQSADFIEDGYGRFEELTGRNICPHSDNATASSPKRLAGGSVSGAALNTSRPAMACVAGSTQSCSLIYARRSKPGWGSAAGAGLGPLAEFEVLEPG